MGAAWVNCKLIDLPDLLFIEQAEDAQIAVIFGVGLIANGDRPNAVDNDCVVSRDNGDSGLFAFAFLDFHAQASVQHKFVELGFVGVLEAIVDHV